MRSSSRRCASAPNSAATRPRRHEDGVRFRILEARDDGVGKPARCRRVAWCQVAVDPWTKPVRDAADRERRDRKPMARGLEADEPEWLGPEAGHDEQIGGGEERIDPGRIEPARELDAKPGSRDAKRRRPACQDARAGPSPTNVTVSVRLRTLAHARQRVEQVASTLEMIHSSDEQEPTLASRCRSVGDVGDGTGFHCASDQRCVETMTRVLPLHVTRQRHDRPVPRQQLETR